MCKSVYLCVCWGGHSQTAQNALFISPLSSIVFGFPSPPESGGLIENGYAFRLLHTRFASTLPVHRTHLLIKHSSYRPQGVDVLKRGVRSVQVYQAKTALHSVLGLVCQKLPFVLIGCTRMDQTATPNPVWPRGTPQALKEQLRPGGTRDVGRGASVLPGLSALLKQASHLARNNKEHRFPGAPQADRVAIKICTFLANCFWVTTSGEVPEEQRIERGEREEREGGREEKSI